MRDNSLYKLWWKIKQISTKVYDSLYWIMCDGRNKFQYRNEKVTNKFTLLFYFIFYFVNITSVGL